MFLVRDLCYTGKKKESLYMYEEYLQFDVLPTPSERSCGLRYIYQYNGQIMCSIEAEYLTSEGILTIRNITKLFTPSYEHFGFSHLGTNLMVDMLLDIHYRLNLPVKKIKGRLSSADRRNRNWETSIPYYANLPRFINKKLPYHVYFCLFDGQYHRIWDGRTGRNIHSDLEEIIKTHPHDIYFALTLANSHG